jgi:DNA-binding NarL/FixJ family response regulator
VTVYAYGRTARPADRKFLGSDPKTERARQIERLLKEGMKPKDIAEALGMTPGNLSAFMSRYGLRRP